MQRAFSGASETLTPFQNFYWKKLHVFYCYKCGVEGTAGECEKKMERLSEKELYVVFFVASFEADSAKSYIFFRDAWKDYENFVSSF